MVPADADRARDALRGAARDRRPAVTGFRQRLALHSVSASSRNDLIGVRAAAGLAEWLVLAVAPSLLIPLLSPAVGETYGVGNALVHSVCLFIGGAAFFSLALLLSTVFSDLWRPMLLAVAVAILVGVVATAFPASSRYSIFTLMNGEVYFRTGRLPWEGLLVSAIVSAVMLWTAAINLGRQDF